MSGTKHRNDPCASILLSVAVTILGFPRLFISDTTGPQVFSPIVTVQRRRTVAPSAVGTGHNAGRAVVPAFTRRRTTCWL
jgi:hypothetical protein